MRRKPYTTASAGLSRKHHRSAIVQVKGSPTTFTFSSVQSNLDLDTQLELGRLRSRLSVS